jgi:alpha-D-xyloside xylohydrolase
MNRIFVALLLGLAAWAAARAPVEKLGDGVLLHAGGAFVRLQIRSDDIVRVLHSRDRAPRVDDLVVLPPGGASSERPKWSLAQDASAAVITTRRLKVSVNLADGAVTFADASGRTILAEVSGSSAPPRLTPATVQGEQTHHVRQTWHGSDGESLFGLGQRQEGKLDIKGYGSATPSYTFHFWSRAAATAYSGTTPGSASSATRGRSSRFPPRT